MTELEISLNSLEICLIHLEISLNHLEISLNDRIGDISKFIRDISNSTVNTVQINKICSRKNGGTCSCGLCSEVQWG